MCIRDSLRDEIKREFALRKDSKFRDKVARQVHSAANSFTPLGETRTRLMADLGRILGAGVRLERRSATGVDKVLNWLRKQDTDAATNAEKKTFDLCVRFSGNIEDKFERDAALARIAMVYAEPVSYTHLRAHETSLSRMPSSA